MISCLDIGNLIGIRGCTDVQPLFNIWINDLEGLTEQNLENWAGSAYCNGQELAEAKIKSAVDYFFNELEISLSDSGVIIENVVDEKVIGTFTNSYLSTLITCQKLAELKPKKSAYECGYLESITIDGKGVTQKGYITLSCPDGSNVRHLPFTFKEGLNTVQLGRHIDRHTVVTLNLPKGYYPRNIINTTNRHDCSCIDKNYLGCLDAPEFNLIGACMKISCRCCMDNLYCSLLNSARYGILYLAGVNILKHAQISNVLNDSNIFTCDWIEARIGNTEIKGDWVISWEKNLEKIKAQVLSQVERKHNRCFSCDGWTQSWIR